MAPIRPAATPRRATGFPDRTEGKPRFSRISFVMAENPPWYSGVARTTASASFTASRSSLASSVSGRPGKARVISLASNVLASMPCRESSSVTTARALEV
jgi:hypothetical protein